MTGHGDRACTAWLPKCTEYASGAYNSWTSFLQQSTAHDSHRGMASLAQKMADSRGHESSAREAFASVQRQVALMCT